jgi:fibronectin type 3 domain-containing protein
VCFDLITTRKPNQMKTPLVSKLPQSWLRRRGAVQLLPGLSVLLALSALMTNNALAALIAYEPFAYTSTIANGAASTANAATPTQTSSGGFSGNWTCSASATVANGLAYGSGGNTLPVLNNSMSTAGATVSESLATPQSSGTVYVGFLVKQTGDNGGNRMGLMMVNSTGTGYMLCYRQNNGVANFPTILSVSSFAVGSQLGTSATARTFANTNLYVVKLTYTSGNVSRIDVYSNPTANQGTAPTADFSVTTGLGTSGALAILGQVGVGATFNSDEWRVGTTFGDAVGFAPPIPGVPTGLGAVAGNNSVSLSWTASSDAATYNVKRSTTSGSGYVTVGTTTAPTVVFTNSVLGGQTYYYVVSAVNGTGESADSSEASATPTFAAPAAPTALNGTPGNNTVGLTWTAASFADSYNVKRSTTSGSGYSTIGTTTSPTVAYSDNTAVDGTVYYYVVSAVNGAGEGVNSSEKAIAMPPAIPTGLGATAGNNSVSLNWTAASAASGYRVKRSTTSGSGYVTVGTTANPTVAYNDPIIGGQTYYYVVTATNASGESLVSSEVSATPVLVAPAAPATLTATPGNNTVGLTWTAAAFATSYNVKRSTTSGAEVTITNVATTSFTDTNAVNGTIYYYVVSALNGAGESADTAEATVTMRPATPTGLGAMPGANQVSLNWTGSSLATGYKVKRSTVSGSGYSVIGTTADPTTTFTDAIIGGVTYYYVVTATNLSGETVSSSEVSAAPTLAAPSAPTGLAATAGDNSVSLTWTAATFSTSYNVKRSTTSGSGYTTISTTGAVTGTNYTDATAVNGTVYYYVVSGTNGAGESANSSEVSATPNFISVYEPFNYGSLPNGTASTGTGETGSWTCGTTPSIVTGLTYTALPTANSAMSTTGGRMYVNLATPTGSGTKWISFLFKCSGDPGGNFNGVYLKGDQTTSIWAGFRGAVNGIVNVFGLATVTSAGTTTTTGTAQGTSANIANTTVHLIVMKIDFNTSGANDTVTLYIDPTANTSSPSVAATTTLTTVNVGTISAIGVNAVGGTTMTADEFRVGQSFGEVVGYNPPSAPTGLVATPGVNTVGLTWNAVGLATGYKVLRGTSTGVYSVTNSAASNAYTDNTAVGGTQYFYVVQATNASGASASSTEATATPTISLPDVPGSLTATGTNGAVQLSWGSATGAAGYNVKRSTTTGTEVTIANVVATSYYDTAVANGTQYFYKVSSTNSAGESANSSEANATPNVPPTAPTGLAATAGSNQVSLSWTGSAGAASYNIKRSTTSGSGYSTIGTTTDPTVAYTDLSAVKFTQYYYVVSAVSAYGESSDSSEVNATPTGVYGPTAYESFNYASLANGTATTATGFTGNWNVSGSPSILAGLTYPNLPTSDNSYSHGAAGAQTTVNLANPLSSGTKYISFLFQGSGNPGANTCGVFLKGNNANSLFAGFEGGFSPTQTSFGIGTVSSTTLGSATALGSTTPIDNTTVHLVVVAINFNTSGTNDTVSLWIDPPADAVTPGVAANVVNSTFDVGTISAFGININGAFPIGIDEVRIGDVYGDVVGYVASTVNTSPTNIVTSVTGNDLTLSWPADHIGWKLQSQTNAANVGLGTNWYDVAGSTTTNQMTFTIDPASPSVFYRMTY